MIRIVGLLTATILSAIGLLHLYWAAGGRWGSAVSVPTKDGDVLFEPSTFATLFVAALLFTAALIILGRVDVLACTSLRWLYVAGSWALTAVFTARVVGDFRWIGIFKRETSTDFAHWDTWLFVPLCALIAIGCATVARFAR